MSWDAIGEIVYKMLFTQTGVAHLWWGSVLMWCVGIFFIYLGAARNKEPLLLVPIGFGIFEGIINHIAQ